MPPLRAVRSYAYTKISGSTTIRLFRFDDHSDPNAIQGQLIETPLSDAPPYFALSYCWGAQVLDTPIQCNGAVMYITKALAQALRQINRHFRSQRPWTLSAEWIWIDQISINQGDVLERSQQVKLMGSIFSQSVQTLVWLGTKHDGCHRAWNLIDQIYQIVQTEHPNANYIADIPIRMFSLAKHFEYGLPEWKDAAWEHLRVLLRNPYFSRVWVIQEVALSPKDPVILHGYHEYSWEKLGWTASWLRRAGYLRLDNLPTQFHSIDTISNIRRSKVPWSLDALLVTTSMKFKATDQRDKVYGLLGIACETAGTTQWPEALLPDYELPIAQVYAKVAEFLISKSGSLAILTRRPPWPSRSAFGSPYFEVEGGPSWVPNWSSLATKDDSYTKMLPWLSYSTTGDATGLGFPDYYNASDGTTACVTGFDNGKELEVRGFAVDSILSAAPFGSDANSWFTSDMLSKLGRACGLLDAQDNDPFLHFCKMAQPLVTQGLIKQDQFLNDFIAATTAIQYRMSGRSAEQIRQDGITHLLWALERETDQRGPRQARSCLEWIQHWMFSCSKSRKADAADDEELLPLMADSTDQLHTTLLAAKSGDSSPDAYIALARNYCFNRAFFITSSGRMGIGPVGLKKGDIVSVLFGGGVPYILRQQGETYSFVGEAYVQGLIHGEGVARWKHGEIKDETFRLR